MSTYASEMAVIAQILGHFTQNGSVLTQKRDEEHNRWQTDGSGYWACSDQFVSGEAKGSRYYPRIITAALWLEEPHRVQVTTMPMENRPSTVLGKV